MNTNDPIRITSRTRSLFIGIDYKHTPFELNGCLNDVNTMINALQSVYFPLREVCTLVDDPCLRSRPAPTRENILGGMKWLVHEAQAGDNLLMYYTGHASQAPGGGGGNENEDGFNETIVPIDYQQNGVIVDDEIYNLLVSGLPLGVRLTIIMDCCHGGTLMDFPYSFEASLLNTSHSRGKMNTSRRRFNPSRHLAEVVMFSGCLDYRTLNANNNNVNTKVQEKGSLGRSAFTNAFAHVITHSLSSSRPFMMLLVEMREILQRKGLSQLPHLAATKPVDMARPFSFTGALPAFTSYSLHTLQQQQQQHAVPTPTPSSTSSTPKKREVGAVSAFTLDPPSTKPQHDQQPQDQQAHRMTGSDVGAPTPQHHQPQSQQAFAHTSVGRFADHVSARSYQAARRRQTSQDRTLGASQELN